MFCGKTQLYYYMIIFIAFLSLNLFADTELGITAITIPSADITLSFLQSGRIDQIHVKEGDKVKAETILVQQYDAAEAAYLAQKRVDLKRLESAQKRGAATDLEVEHAKLEVQIAEIRVDNMKLKSPIDGFVEKLEVEVGESVQALVDVIRIVKIDPLWVDVYVPQEKIRDLKVDDSALVNFSGPDRTTLTGKVIFVSRAADAASDTRRVRIEMPNTTGRPSGEHVLVSFNGTGETKNENKK